MLNKRFWMRTVLSVLILAALSTAVGSEIKAAQIRTLNYFMPSSYAGLNDPAQARQYLRYYRFVFFFTSIKSDALAMMGFCYAQNSQWIKANEAYQKALQLKPDSFWLYYNLAVIYSRQGHGQQAKALLEKAVNLDFRRAMEHILTSRIYLDIDRDFQLTPEELAAHLMNGYRQASVWIQGGRIDPAAKMNIF